MLSAIIGGIIAAILGIISYKMDNNQFYIGQKVYYYVTDRNKPNTGRITATVLCFREEDVTIKESRRIIPNCARKIASSKWLLLEIQPVLGGRKIVVPASNILERIGD